MAKYTDDLHQRVTNRIREIAAERGIAVTNLPGHVEMSPSTFWGIMAGRSSPTLAWLGRIAAGLDVDVEDLVAKTHPKATRAKPRAR